MHKGVPAVDLAAYPSLLRIAEAAALLNVSITTIRRKVGAHEIESTRLGDGPKAPIRILRDRLLERFGLVDHVSAPRRDRGKTEREQLAAAAALGIAASGRQRRGLSA